MHGCSNSPVLFNDSGEDAPHSGQAALVFPWLEQPPTFPAKHRPLPVFALALVPEHALRVPQHKHQHGDGRQPREKMNDEEADVALSVRCDVVESAHDEMTTSITHVAKTALHPRREWSARASSMTLTSS